MEGNRPLLAASTMFHSLPAPESSYQLQSTPWWAPHGQLIQLNPGAPWCRLCGSARQPGAHGLPALLLRRGHHQRVRTEATAAVCCSGQCERRGRRPAGGGPSPAALPASIGEEAPCGRGAAWAAWAAGTLLPCPPVPLPGSASPPQCRGCRPTCRTRPAPDPACFAPRRSEVTHRHLAERPDGWPAGPGRLGRRCLHLTWAARGAISLEGLGLEVTADPCQVAQGGSRQCQQRCPACPPHPAVAQS